MGIEERMRSALQAEAQAWTLPEMLDVNIRQAYNEHYTKTALRRKWSKKLLIPLLAVFLLLVPTSVFAFVSLADEIYGSFDTLKKNVASVTMQEFTSFGMKLSGAKAQLGNQEYAKFIKLLKKFTAFRMEYGKSFQIDDTTLTLEKRSEYKQLLAEMQPYFDKLNKELSSREALTAEEFDAYIEAQIVYSRIAYRISSKNGAVRSEQVPDELRGDYDRVQRVLELVRKKTTVK